MLSKLVDAQTAASLLGLAGKDEVSRAICDGFIRESCNGPKGSLFTIEELVIFKLAEVMRQLGVGREKALRYSEAVLQARLEANQANLVQWVENETQELFCLIADNQLTRIFLRNRDDDREVDVGAVKPVLFPSTRCEINVFRVIRPVIVKAKQVLGRA